MVAPSQEHVTGIAVSAEFTRFQSHLMPPNRSLGVVEVQLGGNHSLNGMKGIHSFKIKHVLAVQVRVANNVEQGTLGNIEDRAIGCRGCHAIGKLEFCDFALGVGSIYDLVKMGELVVGVPASTAVHQTAHHFLHEESEARLLAVFIDNVEDSARSFRIIVAVHGNIEIFRDEGMFRRSELGPLEIGTKL